LDLLGLLELTSQGTFLGRGQDAIVQRIEEKIATWTQIPSENGEGLQVSWEYFSMV
jgi:hypothetical protein